MSGVLLRRFGPCPSCGQPQQAYTHPGAGTRLRPCDPARCRIARVKMLAGASFPSWFEPMPLTDRRAG
jgi:hypothetical protein